MRNKRIVFLCSGGGGNLRFIHNVLSLELLEGWELLALICDRPCPALTYAKQNKIPAQVMEITKGNHHQLFSRLCEFQADLVVTTVHKVLAPEIVRGFKGRLINLHYSLLPSFGGKIGIEPVKDAIDFGAKICGATVHYVSDDVDAGKPIVQIAFPLLSSEDLTDIMDVEFRAGCISLYTAIKVANASVSSKVSGNNVVIKNRFAVISPCIDLPCEFDNESFWRLVAQP